MGTGKMTVPCGHSCPLPGPLHTRQCRLLQRRHIGETSTAEPQTRQKMNPEQVCLSVSFCLAVSDSLTVSVSLSPSLSLSLSLYLCLSLPICHSMYLYVSVSLCLSLSLCLCSYLGTHKDRDLFTLQSHPVKLVIFHSFNKHSLTTCYHLSSQRS